MIEILLMVLLLLVTYGMGAPTLRLLRVDHCSKSMILLLSIGLGFGIIAYVVFFLGILGLLYVRTAYILLAVLLIGAFPNVKRILSKLYKDRSAVFNLSLSRLGIVTTLILVGYIVVNLIADLAPPANGDTLAGYLAVPKIWVQNHKVVEIPYLVYAYLPSNIPMLSTLGLLLKSDLLSQLISGFLMGILAMATIYSFAREGFSRETSLTAAAIFYATPVVSWLSHSAKVDLGWTFFELLAIYTFFNFFSARGKETTKWALLSGIFCGFSMGTKYASFSAIIIALGIIIKILVIDKKELGRTLKVLAHFLIPAVLIASPWYIRNYLFTGNPVYPVFTFDLAGKGCNQSSRIIEYFTIFWHMSMIHMSKGMSQPAGPIFIAFTPCLLLLRKINYRIKFMLIYSLAFSILWYSQVQFTRHFLPALALLAIVAAYSIYRLMDSNALLRRFVPLVLVGMLSINVVTTVGHVGVKGILFVFGGESRETFLSRAFSKGKWVTHENYEMIKYINTKTDKSVRILVFGSLHPYYIERDYIGYYWYKPGYFGDTEISREKDIDKLMVELKRKKITHVFVNPFKFVKVHTGYSWEKIELDGDPFPAFREAFGNTAIFSDESRGKYLKLVFSYDGQYLYKIRY